MKKIVIAVLIIGGLMWAKKHYIDKTDTVRAPTKEEEIAEKIGRAGALRLHPSTATAAVDSAAASTGTIDQKEMSGLMASITKMLRKEEVPTTPEERAKLRVTKFMALWKEGGTSLNDAAQASACMWSRGVGFIPNTQEIEDAATGFYHWRKDKGLYGEIESYSVGEATRRVDRDRGDYTEVDVMINHATYRIGVPDKANPLFWTF
jgi:hypothetical protein